jgi:hypothetical protein
MVHTAPIADLDRRFSSPGAKASSWAEARRRLREAPPIAVWLDDYRARIGLTPSAGTEVPR